MTATIAQIRAGLQARLATISGLRAWANWPDTLEVPAAIVTLEDLGGRPGVSPTITYHEAMGSPGHFELDAFIVVLSAPVQQGYQRGQEATDAYLDPSGSQSIKEAIEGDLTLGGVVDTLSCTRWVRYGQFDMEGLRAWGAVLEVKIYA